MTMSTFDLRKSIINYFYNTNNILFIYKSLFKQNNPVSIKYTLVSIGVLQNSKSIKKIYIYIYTKIQAMQKVLKFRQFTSVQLQPLPSY